MIALATAVIVASVLGSLHCVGMCGPFALWATGAENSRHGGTIWPRMSMYHLGRLVTYLTAGLLAGTAGSLLSAGGHAFGVQSAASRVVGVSLLALGVARLAALVRRRHRGSEQGGAAVHLPTTGRIAGGLARLRPGLARLPGPIRAGAIGSLTTLLPCGWLYLFVLVAAGTGEIALAMAVMFAFWLGTLPALIGLVAGALRFASTVRPAMPVLGALLLMATGLYTATGRASADLAPLRDAADSVSLEVAGEPNAGESDPTRTEAIHASEAAVSGEEKAQATLKQLSDTPLPCCQHGS